ncbi:zinc-binding alcohol dehydrogenase [Capsaspora owczarzaki ATCC 30864]|uniref:Zinc-binding alcohol dehydrogenase n=1 Tax=Capsaspora owczarzaki (strain ATCC 30864) TaxID=595528 RepID=A0A0D2VJI6_CAPO3|nr:zinc-binding alcohol dehydrogenase [Capsaspora owczarzaki ATCC 30864]KJE90112.1 zinc-binding alcohol dehydrogenase [Capsaspora owczarzaki ATCC 30864]|eukprot:XP_004364330.1 zinc-binding alcohol dehydrogenase [Capsaspora owczarzaki ATCC 30864]
MYNAIRVAEFGAPAVMQLRSVAIPETLGASEVLVRVAAAGVNPVDTYIRKGNYASLPSLPYTPGKDGAGIVHRIGDSVSKVKAGDRVYLSGSKSGTYAEMTICDVSQVHHLPANVSFEKGASLGVPYATAYRALFQRCRARSAETVLVHGASGGVGLACVQFARVHGLTVIGTASSKSGRELILAQGAHHALDHSNDQYVKEVMDITKGQGVHIVMEMLANVNLEKDLTMIRRHGRIAIIGNRGSLDFNPRAIMSKEAELYGVQLGVLTSEEADEIHAAIWAGLTQGFLDPAVGSVFPLADAARAHEEIIDPPRGAVGKVILRPEIKQ